MTGKVLEDLVQLVATTPIPSFIGAGIVGKRIGGGGAENACIGGAWLNALAANGNADCEFCDKLTGCNLFQFILFYFIYEI